MSQEDEASNLTNAAAIAEARATATGASAANAVGETAPQEPKEAAATESGVTTAEAGTTGAGAVNAMGEAAPEEASNTAAVVNATVEEAPEVPKETDREEPAPVASGEPEALGEIPANEQVQAVETASRAARTYSKEVVQRARQASKEAQAAEEEAEAVETAGRAARTYSKEVVQRARQASKEAQAAEEEAEAVESAGRAARTYSKEVVQRARQASKEAQAADEEAQALEAASRAARTYSKEVVQRVCQDIETAKEESIAVREAAAEAEVADARGEAAREDAETAVAEDSQSPEAEASVGEQDQEAAEETPAEEMPAEEEPSDVQEDSPQTEETDDSGWKDTKDEPKEITWSSLSVATDDVQESLETAVQYTSMAQNLRAKGLIPRAIRMMERALMITQRSELEHPSLALEACKVRLNFAAYLSEGYRHREALKVIKEAQENLMRLVHWALQCPPEDLAVQALGKEARALHCSAVVAEAVALEFFEDDGKPPPDEMPEDLKEMARMTGASMPPDHPLPWLVRQTLGSSAASRASNRKRSVLAEIKRMSVSNMPLTPSPGEELTAPAADLPKPEPEKQKKRLDELPRPKRGPEDRDVFKQYLRDREMARVAHLLALSDDWETQTRKKLEEVHRQAKFEMELVNVDELKEKRYSRLGHKVFMHQMRNMNRCWSDPTLSREARREKTAPEIHQLKKLSRKIYVKPPATQAPAPPPPKPKVDSSLAGSMKAMREEHA